MEKRKIGYTSISISKPLMKKIKEYLAENKTYSSAGEFIRSLIREKIEK